MELDEIKSVAILGDINSAKTNLAFKHLRDYKGTRQIYLVGYPRKIDNFKEISNFQDLFELKDSIIFFDEIQKYIKIYDRRANYDLMELISFFAHNNNTLIFTTCLSQFISKSIEGYIDCWNLTRIIDLKSLKNGSKSKRIIERTTHPKCTKWSLALRKGEYLEYSELNNPEANGVKKFEDQHIEKDWRVEDPERFHYLFNDKKCDKNSPKKNLNKKNVQKPLKKSLQDEHNNSEHTFSDKIYGIIPINKKSPQEMKGPTIKKDLLNKEISKLAWGGKK